jgi:hypothetical protein
VRSILLPVSIALLSYLLPSAGTAAEPTVQGAAASFARLKSLAGEWKGESGKGKKVRLTYQVIAGGTAVLETFRWEGSDADMTTVYHLDGDTLMLTHYCVSNNQPRMRAASPAAAADANVLQFDFIDGTNLANPGAGHMHKATLRFLDGDRIGNAWTYFKDGKDAFTETGTYERVKR